MNKRDVIKLLEILENNDCLHPEWNWGKLDDETETIVDLTDDSEWVVDEINSLINE